MAKVPKYAAKRDTNEREIVQALRMIPGVMVHHLSAPGVPDLLVSRNGVNYLMEIKGRWGKLTDLEKYFFETWTGQAAIVRDVDEALRVIGVSE